MEKLQLGESKIYGSLLVKKPAQRGTIGRKINVVTNHYKVDIKPITVQHYDLTVLRAGATNEDKERDRELKDKEFVR